jgi:hypothetical protein
MQQNIVREVEALGRMSAPELREKYQEVFGEEPRSTHKDFLRKRIAWRIQANAEGGLSERARRRAEEIANDADLRLRAPKRSLKKLDGESTGRTAVHSFKTNHDRRLPMPGAVITREYNGERISVIVRDDGFEYEGQVFRSLTAIAKAITGSHWNGYDFFRLRGNGGKA